MKEEFCLVPGEWIAQREKAVAFKMSTFNEIWVPRSVINDQNLKLVQKLKKKSFKEISSNSLFVVVVVDRLLNWPKLCIFWIHRAIFL